MKIASLVFVLLATVACASDEPRAPYPPVIIHADAGDGAPVPTAVVSIWAQPHEFIPIEAIFDGCDYWNDVGVSCMSAPAREAQIRVYIDETKCTEETGLIDPKTDKRTLGLAWYDSGDIKLFPHCFFKANYMWYHQGLRNLASHEVGHTLGISHAAASCNDEILSWTDQGDPICGPAIMNPFLSYNLTGLTGVDHQAFQYRTRAGALGHRVEVLESP